MVQIPPKKVVDIPSTKQLWLRKSNKATDKYFLIFMMVWRRKEEGGEKGRGRVGGGGGRVGRGRRRKNGNGRRDKEETAQSLVVSIMSR